MAWQQTIATLYFAIIVALIVISIDIQLVVWKLDELIREIKKIQKEVS